jgi:hypothetical protein
MKLSFIFLSLSLALFVSHTQHKIAFFPSHSLAILSFDAHTTWLNAELLFYPCAMYDVSYYHNDDGNSGSEHTESRRHIPSEDVEIFESNYVWVGCLRLEQYFPSLFRASILTCKKIFLFILHSQKRGTKKLFFYGFRIVISVWCYLWFQNGMGKKHEIMRKYKKII